MRPHYNISPESINKRPTDFPGFGRTYPRENFKEHGEGLSKNLEQIVTQSQKEYIDVKDRYFVEIHVADDEKLRDRFQKLRDKAHLKVLSIKNQTVGYAVIKQEDVAVLRQSLHEYATSSDNTGKSYYSFIEEIKNINHEEKISSELREEFLSQSEATEYNVTIETFNSLPETYRGFEMVSILEGYIEQENGKLFKSRKLPNGSYIIEARLSEPIIKSIAEKLSSIKTVEPSSTYSIMPTSNPTQDGTKLKVNDVKTNGIVGIIDTGIDNSNPLFEDLVVDRECITPYYDYATEHGTSVASRAIFGEDLIDQIDNGELEPKVSVLDIPVLGLNGQGEEISLSEGDLLRDIGKAVKLHHEDVRVYNISLALTNSRGQTTLNENQASRLAQQLDDLSRQYDVLFVVSAGNIPRNDLVTFLNAQGGYPHHFDFDETRICVPSEAYNCITVGSVVTKNVKGSLANVGEPSPYSRKGPGINGTRKPDLVAGGGNYLESLDDSDKETAIPTVITHDPLKINYLRGTSFTAPIISSYAAQLFDYYPDASNNMIKALLIHFSSSTSDFDADNFGYGSVDLDKCMNSLKSKASFIHNGVIEPKQYYQIPFWVPTCLTDSGNRSGKKKLNLRITLVWDPITDRLKREDYCLNHLNINVFKLDGNQQISKLQTSTRQLKGESIKDKEYPVIYMETDFEQEKYFSAGKWYAEVRLSNRWDVPEDYVQNFSLIVSVEDPNNDLDVYQDIQNEVGVAYPVMVSVENESEGPIS